MSGMIVARASRSGTFIVRENDFDFTDIERLSVESQIVIREMASQGVIFGRPDGRFNPEDPVTRAEFAAMVVRMLQINLRGGIWFADIPANEDAWHRNYVAIVAERGIMHGTGENAAGERLFTPNWNMPRQQLVVITARMAEYRGRATRPSRDPLTILEERFIDADRIDDWAIPDVALAFWLDLITPRYDGRFIPHQEITRLEAAEILSSLRRRVLS